MHGLAYKTDEVDWKRKRIAAQIKAMVEQLDQLIVSFEAAASPVVESPWPDTDFLKAIYEMFRTLGDSRAFPAETTPSSWSRFSENLYALLKASKTWPRNFDDRLSFVNDCLETLEIGISNLHDFPVSISLQQLALGILWEAKKIQPDLRGFTAVITPELEALFPSLRSCATRFNFDNNTD